MEKKWGETAVPWSTAKPKPKRKKKLTGSREDYNAYLKKLEDLDEF